jgi:hypothetical protein
VRAPSSRPKSQGDVAVAADDEEVDDDAAQPRGDEQPAEAGADGDDEAGSDLDDAHEVHGVCGAQDRRDGERDPQQHERLRDGIAAGCS